MLLRSFITALTVSVLTQQALAYPRWVSVDTHVREINRLNYENTIVTLKPANVSSYVFSESSDTSTCGTIWLSYGTKMYFQRSFVKETYISYGDVARTTGALFLIPAGTQVFYTQHHGINPNIYNSYLLVDCYVSLITDPQIKENTVGLNFPAGVRSAENRVP